MSAPNEPANNSLLLPDCEAHRYAQMSFVLSQSVDAGSR